MQVLAKDSGSNPTADQFDRVTVRVLDEGNDGRAGVHRAGVAQDLAAALLDAVSRRIDIVDLDRDVAIGARPCRNDRRPSCRSAR
jgi:hypothetical protein